jgi:hypothetical protein
METRGGIVDCFWRGGTTEALWLHLASGHCALVVPLVDRVELQQGEEPSSVVKQADQIFHEMVMTYQKENRKSKHVDGNCNERFREIC